MLWGNLQVQQVRTSSSQEVIKDIAAWASTLPGGGRVSTTVGVQRCLVVSSVVCGVSLVVCHRGGALWACGQESSGLGGSLSACCSERELCVC